MMATTAGLVEAERAHSSGVVPAREVALVRGKGARVWDADGRRYLDCTAGHGVANIGHAHPDLQDAISRQSGQLITCAAAFPNDQRSALLARLVAITPARLDRFFLCNSGTEAVEAALKFGRIASGRSGMVAAMRSFHGRTFGALSTTWERAYREPFQPLLAGVTHVPFDNIEKLDAAITGDTGVVILEVVQGEGGVRCGNHAFFDAARKLCDERGAFLIIDEVQTGFGRTGRMFACEHYGIEPDFLCMGKAMAGGLPMGAVGISPRVGALPPGSHGSTFGGNPLCCAAAIATVDVIEREDLIGQAEAHGVWIRDAVAAFNAPIVREVRGLGLMIGIELRERVAPFLAALQTRGILALAAGPRVIRLLPPLGLLESECDELIHALKIVLMESDQ